MQHPDEYVILDLETTGLEDTDEMVQISVVDMHGNVLLDQKVRPVKAEVSSGALAVHGITMAMLRRCETFKNLSKKISAAIGGRNIITYNADFDRRLYTQTHRAAGGYMPQGRWECAMKQYAQYVGEWDVRHGSYKWQKLQGGDHSAAGDCLATLDLIHKMAGMSSL